VTPSSPVSVTGGTIINNTDIITVRIDRRA